MLNRAVAANYAPSEVFAVLVALAAIEADAHALSFTVECGGDEKTMGSAVPTAPEGGSAHRAHGVMDLRKALAQSCTTYFTALAQRCGDEAVLRLGARLGFGQVTGIPIDGESAGLLPREGPGSHVVESVLRGEGSVLLTPLQMGVLACALANGGCVHRPSIILSGEDGEGAEPGNREPLCDLKCPPEMMGALHGGLADAVASRMGACRRCRVEGVDVCAVGGTSDENAGDGDGRTACVLAFAPAEAPRIAAVIVIEDAVSAGLTAAPRMKLLLGDALDILRSEDRNRAPGDLH